MLNKSSEINAGDIAQLTCILFVVRASKWKENKYVDLSGAIEY